MNPPPPPCVSKTNPEYIAWRFAVWQKNNRKHINEYNRQHYKANILRERERHRLYARGCKQIHRRPTIQPADKMELDRIYREEMAGKGFIL